MYFPYLHGRQAELLAISGPTARLGTPQLIVPIVEPVDPAAGIKRALAKIKDAGNQVYLVVNPHQGTLRDPVAQTAWRTEVSTEMADTALVRPTLVEVPTTSASDIAAFAASFPSRKIGLVLNSSRIAPADVATALASADVLTFLRPGANPTGYSSSLGSANTVEITDNFNAQARNSDYGVPEWLSNNHLTYSAAGHPGFADYTVLPGKFVSGGGPVGAAAFHLSYKETDATLWVQHFVSDETDRNIGTSSSKLLEAMAHLQDQLLLTPARFAASPALASYRSQLATGSPTNLSGNKQLQIAHHLYTVGEHLGL